MKPIKITPKRILIFVAAIFVIAFFACGVYSPLTVTRYEVASPDIPPGCGVRAVLIADLHSYIFGKNQSELIEKIKNQQPDIIFLAGDIIDDKAHRAGALEFLDGIKNLCPAYYVPGNHEYWSGDIKNIRDIVEAYGIKIISDRYETVQINGAMLLIAGSDDPAKMHYEDESYNNLNALRDAFKSIGDEPGYKILLAHRPENIDEYSGLGFDLALTGHAHGGQIRIPFLLPGGLYAPSQGLFPKYTGGLYKSGGMTQIVSRGLSVELQKPRFFNPPEIVVIDIIPTAR